MPIVNTVPAHKLVGFFNVIIFMTQDNILIKMLIHLILFLLEYQPHVPTGFRKPLLRRKLRKKILNVHHLELHLKAEAFSKVLFLY